MSRSDPARQLLVAGYALVEVAPARHVDVPVCWRMQTAMLATLT